MCTGVLQERIGGGDFLPAPYILALHLYTIPSNLFRLTNKAMREGDTLAIQPFRVFVWYLWNALNRLTFKPSIVYRGLHNTSARQIITSAINGTIVFPAFTSTSIDVNVAVSFMNPNTLADCVILKIGARSCREILAYSYKPLERELLLPPICRFVIKGVFEATRYNLQVGDQMCNAAAHCTHSLFSMLRRMSENILLPGMAFHE
jgi:hypothetical protein